MCDCGVMDLITDHSTGDTVCVRCGVVVEAHEMVDCFYDSTEVAAPPARKRPRVAAAVARAAAATDCGIAAERDVEGRIRGCMGNMRIASNDVLRWAKDLYADVTEAKPVRGEDARQAFVAAAVYFACKMCGEATRELRTVSGCGGVDPAALNAAVAAYKDRLEHKPYHARLFDAVPAHRLINMYAGRLEVDAASLRLVQRDAHALHDALERSLDCSRAPRTICSALTWLAAARNGLRGVSKKDVAAACSVCIQSIDKCLNDIYAVDPSLKSAAAPAPKKCAVV